MSYDSRVSIFTQKSNMKYMGYVGEETSTSVAKKK